MSEYIAITAFYWGKGKTVAEAERNMRKAGGDINERRHGAIVKRLPDGASGGYVDPWGHVCWEKGPDMGKCEVVKDTRKKEEKKR